MSDIQRFEKARIRIESAIEKKQIPLSDGNLFYSSIFISIVSRWEALLENILYEAVCSKTEAHLIRKRLVGFKSKSHFRQVLLYPGKRYVSFASLKEAENVACLFLRDGLPFCSVSQGNRDYLSQASIIRNAIAHESDFALRKFRETVPGVKDLPPRLRRPGPFLRSEFRRAPAQRRCQIYFGAFQMASQEMMRKS